jgi:hypothetical protein
MSAAAALQSDTGGRPDVWVKLGLTRTQHAVIKAGERVRWHATSQQCPGASPGRRLERITSPRFPAPKTRGGHESRALQVVGRRALSPAPRFTASWDLDRRPGGAH